MKDILELLFSRTIFRWLTELIGYSFKAVKIYFIWSIPLILLAFSLAYFKLNVTDDNERLVLAIVVIYLLAAIPATVLLYRRDTRFNISRSSINFGILETLMLTEKEYLNIDFETARINEKQSKFFRQLTTKEPFATGIVFPWLLSMPRLFYISKSVAEIKNYFSAFISPERYVAILIVIKDTGGSRIEFDVLYEPIFIHDKHLATFWSNFNVSIIDQAVTEEYVLEVSKIFSAQMGQTVLDMATGHGDFAKCHKIIDDCQQIFEHAFNRIKQLLGTGYNDSLAHVEADMLANMERYRGITFLNQREFLAAIRHFFKAIKINPYFPYNSYEDFREAYNRKYVSAVAFKTLEVLEDIQLVPELEHLQAQEKFVHPGHDANDLNEYPFAQFYEEIITSLIREADSDEINDVILDSLDSVSPEAIRLILKGELLKYMKKGTEKFNEIYQDRIPNVIQLLEAALILDPDFVLLHGRIGTLMFIHAMGSKEEEQATLMEGAFQRMNRGKEIYARLGYDIGIKK